LGRLIIRSGHYKQKKNINACGKYNSGRTQAKSQVSLFADIPSFFLINAKLKSYAN
jgi:hypothetical protein